jgi:hypothetical protein
MFYGCPVLKVGATGRGGVEEEEEYTNFLNVASMAKICLNNK